MQKRLIWFWTDVSRIVCKIYIILMGTSLMMLNYYTNVQRASPVRHCSLQFLRHRLLLLMWDIFIVSAVQFDSMGLLPSSTIQFDSMGLLPQQ